MKEEIVVGKAYVNEAARVIREVVEEVDDHHVNFNAFELDTGKLIPARHRAAHKRAMARWADRAALPSETDLIHPFEEANLGRKLLPPGCGTLHIAQARAAIDASPGTHLLPRIR